MFSLQVVLTSGFLRLDISMEDSISVHVLNGFQELVDVAFDFCLGQVVGTAFDRLIQVHLHDLKDEGQPPSRLIVQHLDQLNNVPVRRQPLQRFNLSKVLNLNTYTRKSPQKS